MQNEKKVVATWSGGIDSTAVIANLLARGYEVEAVTLEFYDEDFCAREAAARTALLPALNKIATAGRGQLICTTARADWLWAFSPDKKEIPRRNKHIMDHLIVTRMLPQGIPNLAMGEYVGADTWVVQDHVSAADCDHRALSAYLYLEYGMGVRLISLQDFGESRFKADRLAIGLRVLGKDMALTTNCLRSGPVHCGECYKCSERAAAFDTLKVMDSTAYVSDPRKTERYPTYLKQMHRP